MIGEMRDRETCEMAIQAALTGHLVFSTLHTNDSASAYTRLLDMGLEPYLITSTVIGILAQRLSPQDLHKVQEAYTLNRSCFPKSEYVRVFSFTEGRGATMWWFRIFGSYRFLNFWYLMQILPSWCFSAPL